LHLMSAYTCCRCRSNSDQYPKETGRRNRGDSVKDDDVVTVAGCGSYRPVTQRRTTSTGILRADPPLPALRLGCGGWGTSVVNSAQERRRALRCRVLGRPEPLSASLVPRAAHGNGPAVVCRPCRRIVPIGGRLDGRDSRSTMFSCSYVAMPATWFPKPPAKGRLAARSNLRAIGWRRSVSSLPLAVLKAIAASASLLAPVIGFGQQLA
jgi:hypothetical protein